jgi:hypothetical protein
MKGVYADPLHDVANVRKISRRFMQGAFLADTASGAMRKQ